MARKKKRLSRQKEVFLVIDPPKKRSTAPKAAALLGANPMGRALPPPPPDVTKDCRFCGKPFSGRPTSMIFRVYCSPWCARTFVKMHGRPSYISDPHQKGDGTTIRRSSLYPRRRRTELERLTKLITTLANEALTPAVSAQIRGRIATIVARHVTTAEEVLDGKKEWGPTQARVFSTLIGKVLPDLSSSHVQHEHTLRRVNEMSMEELERLIAENSMPTQVIEGEVVHDVSQPDPSLLDGVVAGQPEG
jgi:hypothetical protein